MEPDRLGRVGRRHRDEPDAARVDAGSREPLGDERKVRATVEVLHGDLHKGTVNPPLRGRVKGVSVGGMRIGEVASRGGVSVKTVRYYERVGILAPASREPNGYRSYGPDALDRIAFTRAARGVGLSLGEVREVIAFRERGEPPCTHVLDLIARRAAELDERIAQLAALRTDLEDLARRGRSLDPAECSATTICHVIPRDM